jgi:chloride channel 7
MPLLYQRGTRTFSLLPLLVFALIYFLLAAITSGLWVAGGLFIPMMLVGGAIGRATGEIMIMIFHFLDPPLDPSIYALMGSAAVMTGFCRMTISLVVILVELTGGTQYLLPIILVVMISKWVGDIFNESIYEHLIHLKHIPFLQNQPLSECKLLTAADVMQKRVTVLLEVEKVSEIVDALRLYPHNGFPVVEKDNRAFSGIILRKHLLYILQKKQFTLDPEPGPRITCNVTYPEFADAMSKRLMPIDKMQFSREEEDMYVDLRACIFREFLAKTG